MLDGYHRNFNIWGFKEVNRGVDMPDADLGVGFAEVLSPTPLLVRFEPKVQPLKQAPLKTLEQASIDGQGRSVSMGDFPNTGYLGEQLGGF